MNDTPTRKDDAMPVYLATPIEATKRTDCPRYGVTAHGYSVRSGAPTSMMVRLQGDRRWRRVMLWQFSNTATMFVRIGGVPHVIPNWQMPEGGE